jgi:hypothetical protein
MSPIGRAAIGVLFVLGCAVAAITMGGLLVNRTPADSSLIILALAYVPYATVGSILVVRRPRNAIGWILLALGWTFSTSFLPIRATAQELQTLTASPLVEIVAWFNGWSVSLIFALFTTLAFVFPSGRLPNGRSKWIVVVVIGATWGIAMLTAFRPVMTVLPDGAADVVEIPNPFGVLPASILGVLQIPPDRLSPMLWVVLLAAIVAIIGRYVRARDRERLQLRWLVAALASITVAIVAGFAILAAFPGTAIAWVPAAVCFMLPPIAVGIAVLRYRLYEIDQIISRTISYGVLTAIISGLFVACIFLFQEVLAPVTQSNTLAVAGATLLAYIGPG